MARIYKVTVRISDVENNDLPTRTMLVEAENPAQARAHATRKLVGVEVASQRDVFDLAKQGVVIENATKQETIPA